MPNLAWTYTTLTAALQAWPVDSAPAYVADLDRIIGLGELRLVRELNLELFDKTAATPNTVIGTPTVAKPADSVQLRQVGVTVAGSFVGLEQRSHDYVKMYYPDPTITGVPQYYAELDSTTIRLAPTPDGVYAMDYRYVARPADSLNSGAAGASSWLSRNVPDALFAACLMEAEHYLKADDRYGDQKDKYYNELLPTARAELRNSVRRGDYAPFLTAATGVQ